MAAEFEGINGDALTKDEMLAIRALARVSRRWPRSLTLLSMGGTLCVIHGDDERYGLPGGAERQAAVLYMFNGIPNDGGDW
jgi:hypothetical protein